MSICPLVKLKFCVPSFLSLTLFYVDYNSFLLFLFYLGDFGERGTTSEKNKAFSSHMGEAT